MLANEGAPTLGNYDACVRFACSLAACWLVPLLDLLVRLNLHIVGSVLWDSELCVLLGGIKRMGAA